MLDSEADTILRDVAAAALRLGAQERGELDPDYAREALDLAQEGVSGEDFANLAEWAHERGDGATGAIFEELADITGSSVFGWTEARWFGEYFLDGLEPCRIDLLHWMRESTPEGRILGEPAVLHTTTPLPGVAGSDVRVSTYSEKPNPALQAHESDYSWWWATWIKTKVLLGELDDIVLPSLPLLPETQFGHDEQLRLQTSIALLHGALLERERSASLDPATRLLLAEIRRGQEEIRRQHERSFSLAAGIAERLEGLERTLGALESLFLEGADALEQRARSLDAEALESAREQLVALWKETHTVRQQEEAGERAALLVGGRPAWEAVSAATRDDLLLVAEFEGRRTHRRQAAVLVALSFERELKRTLERLGTAPGDVGNDLERALAGAKQSADPRLAGIAGEVEAALLRKSLNDLRHGKDLPRAQLDRVFELLVEIRAGQHGFLGRLVVIV